MEQAIYLIIGLGNPGREYRATRHNVGFMVVDELAQAWRMRMMRVQAKAIIGSGIFADQKVVLAKPQTYMNLSGESVVALMRFYKIPLAHLLVVHDDLDLPLGTLRLRPDGGAGGQKGIASIIQRLGGQDFPRLRIGIGRPPGQMEASTYVLQDFTAAEQEVVRFVLLQSVRAIETFVSEGLEMAMNRYNGAVERL
jgi:PTH1 family peptidyl-tRNA hydrolase